jgi:hypothetical protein
MALSEKDKKDIAKAIALELASSSGDTHGNCRFAGINPEQHKKDHEAIQEIADFYRRVNNIKWNSLQMIVSFFVGAGLIALAKLLGFSIQGPGGP